MDSTSPAQPAPEQTWTFVGHWEGDRIEVEYILEGEVADDRDDDGTWPEGLWAASASGATVDEAEAIAIAEYESDEDDDPFDGECGHCGAVLRTDTRQDLTGSTRCDDADPAHLRHIPQGADD